MAHGLTITESDTGPRALGVVSLAVIGIVATATAPAGAATTALNEAFPLNTPVLITGGVDIAAGKAGTGGTLGPTLRAIGDQASPVVVVVRVEEGEDQAKWFAEQHLDALRLGAPGQLLPGELNDGFYYALFKKNGP